MPPPIRKCFVISPIGPAGSAIREHADDVLECIIKPAMLECEIEEPKRSDYSKETGKISEQMFRDIQIADLLIAVLTGHNANVFYELAIAHAASKPVIILIQKGEALPFDIKDLRCVEYDVKPRSIIARTYIKEIVDFTKAIERAGWKAPCPFGKALLQASSPDDPETLRFFRNGHEFGDQETWLRVLRESNKAFEIMGIHLGPWKSKDFSSLIRKKAAEGCLIRALLVHPDNPTLPHIINEALTEVTLDGVIHEIEDMWKFFSNIAKQSPNVLVRQVHNGVMHCQTTRSDRYAVYLPYAYSRRRRDCPLWRCNAGSVLYDLVEKEFDAIWEVNAIDSVAASPAPGE